MNSKAKWLTGLLAAGWFVLPGVTESPASGVPLTRAGFAAFAAVWTLLFAVLPWRLRRGRAWFISSAGTMAGLIALKLTAAFLSVPQGLSATYESLDGVADLRPHIAAALGRGVDPPIGANRAWQRIDREIQFADNGFSAFSDSFHLLFCSYPPLSERAKADGLDRAPLRVTWRGCIDFPRDGFYVFQPRTDGYWSVWLGGDLGLVQAGGPGVEPLYVRKSIDHGPREVVIRYLRPSYPAGLSPPPPVRFELRWDPPRGGDQAVTWRRLYPDTDVADTRVILNHVGEGLQWTSFGGACLLALAWTIFLVDWRKTFRPFFSEAMILWLLGLFSFAVGVAETSSAAGDDPNWCIPDGAVQRRALKRSLLIWHRGEPVPAEAPAAVPVPALPPDLSDNPVLNLWLKTIAVATDGLLGPMRWQGDAAAQPPEPFPDSPLWDYQLAAYLRLFEERLGVACLFQALMTAAALVLTYGIGRIVFGRRAGLLAAGALALDLHFSAGAAVLLPDHSAAVLTAAAVLAVLFARRARRTVGFAGAGLLLGLVFLLRPDLVLLPVFAGAWLLWPKYGDSRVRPRLGAAAAMMVPILLMWSLVPVRNHQLSGQAIWWTTELPTRAIAGNALDAPGDDRATLTAADAVERLLAQPGSVRECIWFKFLRTWGIGQFYVSGIVENGRAGTLTALRYTLLPMLYLAVVLAMLRRLVFVRRDAECALLLLAILAVLLPLVLLDFQDRYRLPMIPLLHVFTGALLSAMITRRVAEPEPEPAPAAPPPPAA